MDRFSDLEQKWIGKQRKKRILFAVFALMAVFGYLVYVQFFDNLAQAPTPKQVAEVVEPKQIGQAKSTPKENDKKPLSLAINKSFEEDIQNKKLEIQKPAKKEAEPRKEIQVVEKKQIEKEKESKTESKPKGEIKKEIEVQKVETKVEEKTEPKKEQNKEMAVQKEEISQSNLEILYIEEFLADKTYEKALKIAKFYFENKKHEKAIKWSLEANKINSADEESWIIFAKSSVVLGRSDQAKRALLTYLQKRDSVNIKKLLNEIR
ncbi:MAG: hypothetical protein QG567_2037 [Campylobacterota bacterium]|nr:hypothetical protein [Campylobacterota bacterium]